MKKLLIILVIPLLLIGLVAGKSGKKKPTLVLIETPYGNMKVRLYDETPLHKENFIKLVNEHFYDSLLFHRVIKDFMIQGGDPHSKNAPNGATLGNGGPGYEIPAEFIPQFYHKKGVIAAAREGDNVNPEKKSSGSQFYIVQGKIFTDEELNQMEERINFPAKKKLVFEYIEKPENLKLKTTLDSLQKARNFEQLNFTYDSVLKLLEPEYQKLDLFHFTEQQRTDYKTIGGTPHLDRNYTVFGEVVEGLNVLDSIANVKTDKRDRPLENIIMKMRVVKK
jgi:peptidylprolyl isomerase